MVVKKSILFIALFLFSKVCYAGVDVITPDELQWGLLNPDRGNDSPKVAFLWGTSDSVNGTFLKLPANFNGHIISDINLKSVVIEGKLDYIFPFDTALQKLKPSAFFSSEGKEKHHIRTYNKPVLLYIRSTGRYFVKSK